ncbi:hypothetical protein SPHINGO8BC_51364 [Sphingobacterium multivorum]|uniref:Uncharacterized protein n=1 Tax=Sphingobacterium multivorum TaxID=28454 RepID=A0A654CY80_SPHMU|nr:hypothetical protein SPHINGO8BC_51364 [Sphingobacterium multivorum]
MSNQFINQFPENTFFNFKYHNLSAYFSKNKCLYFGDYIKKLA